MALRDDFRQYIVAHRPAMQGSEEQRGALNVIDTDAFRAYQEALTAFNTRAAPFLAEIATLRNNTTLTDNQRQEAFTDITRRSNEALATESVTLDNARGQLVGEIDRHTPLAHS